jgi:hypothetical protein
MEDIGYIGSSIAQAMKSTHDSRMSQALGLGFFWLGVFLTQMPRRGGC